MTAKEKLVKVIETLDEVKSEISEVKLKLYSLETASLAIIAVIGESDVGADKNNLRLLEATLQVVNISESKVSLKKEIDAIKSRISSYEQLESIISEKEELSKKYDDLRDKIKNCINKYNKAKKLYDDELATFETEILGEKFSNDNKTSEPCSETPVDNTDSVSGPIMVIDAASSDSETMSVNYGTDSESDSITAIESVSETTSDADEENSESNSLLDHPMMGVLNTMSAYNDLYTYDTKTNGEKYSVAYSNLWNDVEISKEDGALIEMLFDKDADVLGMTPYQVRKLVLSLPTELLKKIGRVDIIEKRKPETKNYVKDGRNSWRAEFTYSVVRDLADWVIKKLNAKSPEEAEKYEILIDQFMEDNTDRLVGKVIKRCVRGAFCIVD